MNVNQRIQSIEQKVKQLANQKDELRSENAKLSADIRKLEKELLDKIREIEILKNKLLKTQRGTKEEVKEVSDQEE